MKEATELLNQLYGRLPKDHPERDAVRAMALHAEVNGHRPGFELFAPDAREWLRHNGYMVYRLRGYTINNPFITISKWVRDHPGDPLSYKDKPYQKLRSRTTEVAFHPMKPILMESGELDLGEQMALVNQLSEDLSKQQIGLRAIVGELPDYVELAVTHRETTGDIFFGFGKPEIPWLNIRTNTVDGWPYEPYFPGKKGGPTVGFVIEFIPRGGFFTIHGDQPANKYPKTFIAPLVIPI